MPTPRLLAIVTALVLLSGRIAGAQYSLEQLQQIERYILSKDCDSLWLLLRDNPELMTGTDPLAQELRIFVESSMRGQLSCFDAPTATVAPVDPTLALGQRLGSIY
jgi:hypothetical protein